MELEIDEYIRTPKGVIGKVINIYDYSKSTHYLIDWNTNRPYCISQIKNIKHSKNIIDLIEVGDYVNGYLVIQIGKDGDLTIDDNGFHSIFPIDIKSIVTKEQFKSIEYKVGD